MMYRERISDGQRYYGDDDYSYNYGRRGNFRARGNGRYSESYGHGDEALEEMMEAYQEYKEMSKYSEGKESKKPLKKLLESIYEFMASLPEEVKSPEDMEMIKHYARKISEI